MLMWNEEYIVHVPRLDGNRPVVAINLFNYLWDWFVHHVLSVDRK